MALGVRSRGYVLWRASSLKVEARHNMMLLASLLRTKTVK